MKTLVKCLACLAVGLYSGAYMGATSVYYASLNDGVREEVHGLISDYCFDEAVGDWSDIAPCGVAYMIVGEY